MTGKVRRVGGSLLLGGSGEVTAAEVGGDHVEDGVLVRLDQTGYDRTALPPAEGSSIIARRNRTELVLPRRTMCWSFCPSCSVNLPTRTGCAIPPPHCSGGGL
ncbi:hypothetical protein SF23_12840 [Streptomyces sp. MBRL 10]|nr:hypothetical protein SF23_12840 [Streptomyces sp. MBRL 10]